MGQIIPRRKLGGERSRSNHFPEAHLPAKVMQLSSLLMKTSSSKKPFPDLSLIEDF
jgi:hypothetical protein